MKKYNNKVKQIRATVIKMAYNGKSSHLSGALSCVDILVGLFYDYLKIFPKDFKNPNRDRFFISKGHSCSTLYAIMADIGFFPIEWLNRYCESRFSLPSHPCIHMLPQLEFSSGSLGHGLGVASGMAYGLKIQGLQNKLFVLMSDGECNEGSVWEAAMFSTAKKLENLVAIIDNNGVQAVGNTIDTMGNTSLANKFEAFGWNAYNINGNNIDEVINVLNKLDYKTGKPNAIIAKTKSGAGISFMENKIEWYYRIPTKKEYEMSLKELEISPLTAN